MRTSTDTARIWFVAPRKQKKGPYSTAQVRKDLAAGGLDPDTLAWRKGLEAWTPLAELEDFAEVFPPDATADAQPEEPSPEADVQLLQSLLAGLRPSGPHACDTAGRPLYRCPSCGEQTAHLKRVMTVGLFLFLVLGFSFRAKNIEACARCVRKSLLWTMLGNLLTAHIIWPLLAMVWIIQLLASYVPGSSAKVLADRPPAPELPVVEHREPLQLWPLAAALGMCGLWGGVLLIAMQL